MGNLIELCLEITNRCNLNCMHCSTDTSSSKDLSLIEELNNDEIFSTISEFAMLGGIILEISGGEPTLYQSLPQIITFAKNKGLEVRLYTNGISNNGGCKPLDKSLMDDLKRRGLNKIIFNLQGPKSEIHDVITSVTGSFTAVCESIKWAKKLGYWVGVHFVPMKNNANTLRGVLKIAQDFSVDEVALLRFVPQGRGKFNEKKLHLRKNELWNLLGELVRLRKIYKNNPQIRTGCPFDFIGFIDPTVKLCNCKAGKSTCNITSKGEVIPCPAFKHLPEFISGNIRKNSLKEIWLNSNLFNQIRRIDYHDIATCSICEKIDVCKGRCLAQRVREYGDLLNGPDPDCRGPYDKTKQKKTYDRSYYSNFEEISESLIG